MSTLALQIGVNEWRVSPLHARALRHLRIALGTVDRLRADAAESGR
jgi:hypothetical protein